MPSSSTSYAPDRGPAPAREAATLTRRRSLGYQANHLARLLAHNIRIELEPLGVVPGQLAQLLALYEEDGLTQTELCRRVQIDQSTMTHTLKRMERDGLVTRSQDPADRRQVIVHLAGRAIEIEEEVVRATARVNAMAFGDLSDAEVDHLLTTFTKLIANLEAAPSGPASSGREA